jgi:SSS family solute:Na+ symporter
MTSGDLCDVAIVATGLIVTVTVGLLAYRSKSDNNYFVADRRLGAVVLAFTMAVGIVGGGVLVIFSEYTFTYGLSALWIFAGLALGLLALLPIAGHYKPNADRQGLYTLPDLFAYTWGDLAGALAAIVVAGWSAGFVILQLISCGKLLGHLLPIPYWMCVTIGGVTVLGYVPFGGLRSVVFTDVLQYCALGVFLVIVAFFAVPQTDYAFVQAHTASMSWADAAGFFLLGGLNIVVSADLWQRVYAAKTLRGAKVSLLLGALLVVVMGVLLSLPALYVRGQDAQIAGELALVAGLVRLVPKWAIGIAFVAIICAILAALDTMVFVLGETIGHDIVTRLLRRPPAGRIRWSRVSMIVAGVAGIVVASLFPHLLTIGLALSSLGLCLVPAVLGKMLRPGITSETVVGSLIFGLATVITLLLAGQLTPINAVATLPSAVLGAIGGATVHRLRVR